MLKDQEKADGVLSYKDEENAYVVLPPNVKFSDLKAEVKAKDGSVNEGTVTYTYEGQIVGKADVTLDNKKSVEKPTITKGTEKTGTTTDRHNDRQAGEREQTGGAYRCGRSGFGTCDGSSCMDKI